MCARHLLTVHSFPLAKCGSCRKKGRECHYSNARDSIFVHEQVNSAVKQEGPAAASSTATPEPTHGGVGAGRQINLRLRRSRKAENGAGEYSTLGELKSGREPFKRTSHSEAILACYTTQNTLRLQSSSPQAALLCPQTQLAAEWSAIFGFDALLLNPLGSWVKSVWSRRGETACLDLASDYALESMRAFRSQDPASVSRACSTAEKALRGLQAAMQSKKKMPDRQDLVMAIMLHCAAEQFVDIASFYYVPHVFGIAELLKSCLEDGVCNNVIRNVISLICFDEVRPDLDCVLTIRLIWLQVNLAITFDRPSTLESVPIPHTPIQGPYELDLALLASDYLLIKVPRLLSLVRSATEYPANIARRSEASRLIKQWYKSTANTYIEKTLEEHMWTARNSDGVMRSPTGEYFEFDRLPAFGLAVRHYSYRILMCGLMQAVDSLDTESIDRDAVAAQAEDISAATSLAMCLDYALKPTNAMPMTALGALMPLQAAYAAWYRLEKRQISDDTEDYRLAFKMKDWSLDSIHSLEAVWCDRSSRRERMEEYAEMVSGGRAFERGK